MRATMSSVSASLASRGVALMSVAGALGCASSMYPGFPAHQDVCSGPCAAAIGAPEVVQGRETRKLDDAEKAGLTPAVVLARELHVGAVWRNDASGLFEPLMPCLDRGATWSAQVTSVALDEERASALAAKLEAHVPSLDPTLHADAIALLRGTSSSSIAAAFQIRYLEMVDYDAAAGSFGTKTKCVSDYKVQPGDRLIVTTSVLDVATGQRSGAGALVAELILTGAAQLEGPQFASALTLAAQHAATRDPASTSSPFARIVAFTYVTAK
jgi:hypothetical protein